MDIQSNQPKQVTNSPNKPSKSIFALLFIAGILMIIVGLLYYFNNKPYRLVSPLGLIAPSPTPIPRPLVEYSFNALIAKPPQPSLISRESLLNDKDTHTEEVFSFITEGKKMTGQINIPKAAPPTDGFPVIVMFRGFVDRSIYTTGLGTRNAAAVFAQNGYVTVAPDQLGYGSSDPEDPDGLAARVKRPYNMINLITSLSSLSFVDTDRIGIWGHSNGGQIALSVLEITSKPYPTTLWAPVSKPFPYSILYYTDEYADGGKALRRELASFESLYDVDEYSIDKYIDRITAPITIHQGTADDAIPLEWSAQLDKDLKESQIESTLHIYPGSDHNLQPGWDTVISRDIAFFKNKL